MKRPSDVFSGAFPVAGRYQEATGFTPVLATLRSRVPGALAVALVDVLGETVDYVAEGDGYEARVAAAHMQLLFTAPGPLAGGVAQTLMVRAAERSFVFRALPDGYGLTLVLAKRSFWISERALSIAEHSLRLEAGWPVGSPEWSIARVKEGARGVPKTLLRGELQRELTVLGRVPQVPAGERVYRVVVDATYEEATLVRERGGVWYVQGEFAA